MFRIKDFALYFVDVIATHIFWLNYNENTEKKVMVGCVSTFYDLSH